jgi:hypothetical protein
MISVVCVYNNASILKVTLLRSLQSQTTGFQPTLLDNRDGRATDRRPRRSMKAREGLAVISRCSPITRCLSNSIHGWRTKVGVVAYHLYAGIARVADRSLFH